MRSEEEILKELHKNRQPGMYGGIPPDTRDSILIEVLIDIRDTIHKAGKDIQEAIWNMPDKN